MNMTQNNGANLLQASRKSRPALILAIITCLSVFAFCVLTRFAVAGNVDPGLREVMMRPSPEEIVKVIIVLSDQADLRGYEALEKQARRAQIVTALRDKAERTQLPLLKFLKGRGLTKVKRLWLINGIVMDIPAKLIPQMARLPGVRTIAMDAPVRATQTISAGSAAAEWNIAQINAPILWGLGLTGQNVVVANVDTGVALSHPAVNATWRGGNNSWYNPYSIPANASDCSRSGCSPCELSATQPCDFNGHGTGTMGIMVGGVSTYTGTATGVAPGAKWISVKGLNDNGLGFSSIIIEGYQWLLNPDGNAATADAPDIINNSWDFDYNGAGCLGDAPLLTAIQNLRSADIAIVFAAGNLGPMNSTSVSPANFSPSFSVGSTNNADVISSTSSRGPNACNNSAVFPDVVAPGEYILVADPTSPTGYSYGSGTSFAAPHVAGALALLKSAFPKKSVTELESALRKTGLDLGPAGPDNTYGNGRIDVSAAYNLLKNNTNPDFNADGRPDVLWRITSTGEIDVWYMDGMVHTWTAVIGTRNTAWQIAGTADFNADGKPDILWRNKNTGEIDVWYMNGIAHTEPPVIGTKDTAWQIAGTGDFNGDGKPDILWRNTSTGEIDIWYMDGITNTGNAVIGTLDPVWQIIGVGNFNSDINPDILCRNSSTGEVGVWYMNGSTLVSYQSIGHVSAEWKVIGVADFNGDGNTDILWRNMLTGNVAVWLMNGAAISQTVAVGLAPFDWNLLDHRRLVH